MPPTPVATPNLIRDPGYLFWAPAGMARTLPYRCGEQVL